ncbi:aspartate/glutamate racemase family protein [Oleomonas cavernae]|uniref:Aspartate/glutamate racemase family protein n=1 Tax=Oleomonas cavernae TaxID=2320859 RepID=A0A418WAT5_9PROT|nr:aspartate/glutamate racemase family protein [Oleomonas cavernae]RJF87064.1 aspartate/glutamate racemase family protein [Oleomonas cavernae]
MKMIGLIGGMSWESTAVYYRQINEAMRQRLGSLHSADIILRSVDFEQVVKLQRADSWDEAGAMLGDAAAGLVRAGADCVLICTNTMHLVADQVGAQAGVPLINIIDETGRVIAASGRRRPLLLATRYTMEHGFYTQRLGRQGGIEALVPNEIDRAAVHSIIFEELCQGIVRESSRARLMEIVARGIAAGADSVILGCTEICLLLDPDALPVQGFDSTAIHARAAVDFALAADRGAARSVA